MGGCTHCQERSCELKRPSVPETQEDKKQPNIHGRGEKQDTMCGDKLSRTDWKTGGTITGRGTSRD